MLPISQDEQEHCHVVLEAAFPFLEVTVRSPLYPREKLGQGLTIVGREPTIATLMPHLRLLRNQGQGDYVWDTVRRDEAHPEQIEMHLENQGFPVIPRLVLIETFFRRDVIRFANLCLSRQAVMKVTRPSGEVLKINVDLPVPERENGRILVGQLAP